jgi:hypothetical protein
MVNDLIKAPRTDVAVPSSSALVSQSLGDYAESMRVANQCRQQLKEADFGLGTIDHAKRTHRAMLPHVAAVDAAYSDLIEMTCSDPYDPITCEMAVAMLQVLFGALSKRKADAENAIKLAACADMFSPLNDVIGTATRSWKPLPKHPAVLAIAIKDLINTQIYSPEPVELRAAMTRARHRLVSLKLDAKRWLEIAEKADEIVFEQDRTAWDAAYALLDSRVPTAMLAMRDWRPSPPCRCDALEKISNAKIDAEEAKLAAAAEQAKLAPPPERKRLPAAKKRSVTKRSKAKEEAMP